MIRINLLAAERTQAKKKLTFQVGQKLTVGCSLILVVAALLIGWRYWSLSRQSVQLDKDIATAQQEKVRLQSIIVTIATARRYCNTAPIASTLELDIPLILCDGALIV